MYSTAKIAFNGKPVWRSLSGTFDPTGEIEGTTGVGDRWELIINLRASGTHADRTDFEFLDSEFFVAYAPGIDNGKYHFPRGTSPRAGFFCIIPPDASAGKIYEIVPYGMGEVENSLTWKDAPFEKCEVEYQSAVSVTVTLRGRFAQMWGEYLRAGRLLNDELFIKSDRREHALERNEYPSAYNVPKTYGVHVAATHHHHRIMAETFFPIQLRWWNQDEKGEEIGTQYDVAFEVDGQPADEISAYQDTRVKITISDIPVDLDFVSNKAQFLVWCNRDGNRDIWYDDLQFSQSPAVADLAGSNQLDGLIWSPSDKWIAPGGSYETFFTIPAAMVDRDETYYIGVLLPFTKGGKFDHVQPVLKSSRSGGLPEPCPLPMEGKIFNYDVEYPTNRLSKAAPGDRYKLRLCMDTAAFNACAETTFLQEVSQVGVRVYEYDTPLNTLFEHWQAIDPDDNIFYDTKRFQFDYPPGQFCMDFVFRAGVLNNQIFHDSADKHLVYEFMIRFDYGGAPQYSNIYRFEFRIEYYNYENMYQPLGSPPQKIKAIRYYNADTGLPLYAFCDDVEKVLVEVELNDGHQSDGSNTTFRGFLDRFPYGAAMQGPSGYLKEHDGYVSPQLLTQLEQAPILYSDQYFDTDGLARMIIDVTGFQLSEQFRVLAIKQFLDFN